MERHVTVDQQFVLGPQDGDSVQLNALGVRFMIRSEQTGGRFSLVEHPLPARSLGSPMHTHAAEDEYSFVVEGEIGARLGDQVLRAGPGDLITKPRGIPHAFWNPGDAPARILEIISPGGFERYFEEVAEVFAPGRPPLVERLQDVLGRYRLQLDMGSVEALMRDHGLHG